MIEIKKGERHCNLIIRLSIVAAEDTTDEQMEIEMEAYLQEAVDRIRNYAASVSSSFRVVAIKADEGKEYSLE